MLKNNIETFLECDKEYNEAEIVLFGAPFDSTTSFRPGTRFGSSAVRHESYGLESYSPYQDKDLRDCKIMDSGDLELSFGNTKSALTDIYHRTALILKDKKLPFMVGGEHLVTCKIMDSGDLELSFGNTKSALTDIYHRTALILKDKKLPFMVGGEHLVTLGAFRAVWEQYPEVCIIHFDAHADLREEYLDAKLSHACVLRRCWEMTGDAFRAVWEQYPEVCIIHFDAHADLREEYLDAKLSHACVLRRCWEMTGDGKIHQFGIRSGDRDEFYWAKEHVKMQKFSFDGLEEALEELKGKPVYFTVDLDVMDPSVFPGTGTPEPGGVSFDELRKAATLVCEKRRCWEMTGDGKIHQFGIRSGDRDEFYWAKEHVKMQKFSFDGLEEALEELKGKPVYFTVDLDVMDPSVFPGTGTPEPGGVSFDELRRAATSVCEKANVVGCDVNELSPHYDQSGASTAAAGKIIREMLLALSKK